MADVALMALPCELLDAVASFLPTRDFNNLRLSCRHVSHTLFPYWAASFFKTKQFMMTDFSLSTLLDISRHPALSPRLTHLVIGLDDLRRVRDIPVPMHTFSTQMTDCRNLEEYNYALGSQESLFATGEAARLLSAALVNLPNLECIDIRDYSSPTRYRDCSSWNSYGWHEHRTWAPRHHHGDVPALYTHCSNFTSRVFKVVIAALGQFPTSRTCPVRRLDLITGARVGCHDDAFALVRAPDTALRTVLEGLTTLHLNLSMPPRRYTLSNSHHHYDFSATHLQRFLTLTPNVSWLRLNHRAPPYGERKSKKAVRAFFSWLASPRRVRGQSAARIANPIAPIRLPLTRLDLGHWELPAKTWTRLVERYSGLEHLCLFSTAAYQRSPRTTASKPEPWWAQFIRALPAAALKRIELRDLYEGDTVEDLERVVFPNEPTTRTIPGARATRDVAGPNDLTELGDACMLYEDWAAEWVAKRRAKEAEDQTEQADQEDPGDDGDNVVGGTVTGP